MQLSYRVYIYAFLSRLFSDRLDEKALNDLKSNTELLELIGSGAKKYLFENQLANALDELNIDFTSVFEMNSHPMESAVVDCKQEIASGLENPVMNFYIDYGYEINLNNTKLLTPDHLAIELGFMQNLVQKESEEIQFKFLKTHLAYWVIPYLIGIKELIATPFYADVVDFTIEFLLSDIEYLTNAIDK